MIALLKPTDLLPETTLLSAMDNGPSARLGLPGRAELALRGEDAAEHRTHGDSTPLGDLLGGISVNEVIR